MVKKLGSLVIAALALLALLLPAFGVYVPSGADAQTAGLFPASASLADVALKGIGFLPVEAVPALGLADPGSLWLIVGLACLVASALLCSFGKGRLLLVSAAASGAALALLGTFTVQALNLTGSLLFGMLLKPAAGLYIPVVLAVCQLGLIVFALIKGKPLNIGENAWRFAASALALMAALCLLLPVRIIAVPDTLTADAADAALLSRAPSVLSEALNSEGNLFSEKTETSFANIDSGDLKALEPYARDYYNLKGIFQIRQAVSAPQVMVLAAGALLLLGCLLGLLRKVDKWFPTVFIGAAVVLLATSVLALITTGEADMYGSASRQLNYAGLGLVTPWPLLMLAITVGAALCGAWSIRVSDVPYFSNPLPEKGRLRLVAAALAVVSLGLMLAPRVSLSYYKAGGASVQSTVEMSGLQTLTRQIPEEALRPVGKNGKALYKEEAKEGQLNAAAVESTVRGITDRHTVVLYAALALTLAGTVLLICKKGNKAAMFLFLGAAVMQAAAWLLVSTGMPVELGSASGAIGLYGSMGTLIFAAFFANMADEDQLPKKYKLFLLMLPFVVLVFMFSYLPLYGWSYAFYNYKFGLPMNLQEFVGIKWFTEMFTTQSANIVRVMQNTLGMSLINLATSWLPMVFAIFLNEITHTRFKKFVQIFTTLPNFISWALVFSFAMCMFSMETGIINKVFMSLGIIGEPVAWLNSPDHIWLKMWAWNTWKGLGWGAIMYLAAISGIDQEQYEAARVDGANRWAQMRHITLPGLLPTFFVLLMLSISNILNNGMDQYLVFQNPMNKSTIEVLDLYVYNITIASGGTTMYSFATAVGILKTLISLTLLFSANFVSKKLRGDSIV